MAHLSQSVAREFPDMTESVFRDLVKQFDGDKNKAMDLLQATKQEELERTRAKVAELKQNFTELDDETILHVLSENDGNVEMAILPLFEIQEARNLAERKRRQEEARARQDTERKRRQEEARRQANEFLANLFTQISADKITQILDKNGGDVDATTDELSAMVCKLELEKEDERLEKEQQLKLESLQQHFADLPAETVKAALAKCAWDLKDASSDLLRLTEQKAKDQLLNIYKSIPACDVEVALQEAKWNVAAAAKQLDALRDMREQARLEEESRRAKAAHEEAERQRQLREAQLRQAEQERQATLQAQAAAAVAAKDQQALEEERKRQLALAKEKEKQRLERERLEREALENERLERERRESERLEAERQQQEAQQREKETNVLKQSAANFLMRSSFIARQVQEKFERAAQLSVQQNPLALVKQDLEDKIRNGDTGNAPLGFEKKASEAAPAPGDQSVAPSMVAPKKEGPVALGAPVSALSFDLQAAAAADGQEVTLAVSTTRVDSGCDIVVSWKATRDVTAKDWIAMFPQESKEADGFVTWEWISSPTREGSVTFKAPSVFGNYLFRYFHSSTYRLQAQSAAVAVGPEFSLSASKLGELKYAVSYRQISGNHYNNAWIGLYEKSQPNNAQFYTYQWVAYSTNHTLTFDVPKCGAWEFRLFPLRKPYIDVARAAFTIVGLDKLALTVLEEENQVAVQCSVSNADVKVDTVWVGIYFVDETNNRQYRRCAVLRQADCTVTFKKLVHLGLYEARLFANSYDNLLCKSNPIKIV